jgi:hypothetical protein
MSEVVLLLPSTDHLQQDEDYAVEGGQYLLEVVQPLT